MKCPYDNCILEVEADKDKITQLWHTPSGVADPRRNSVKLVTTRKDHPLGLAKADLDVGGAYFEWLPETSFQKVRVHLVREYVTADNELSESVGNWMRRKLDELWIVSESACGQ